MHTVEAVEDVACLFEAFVGFLAAVSDLGVDSDVVVAAVAEQDSDSDIMFRRY